MRNPLQKVMDVARNRTTYRIGLMQTKAYRLLQQRTTRALVSSGITPPEWAFLGVLRDSTRGIRLSQAAEELGVEAPFVTAMMRKLSKMKYVTSLVDKKDSRAKIICLTDTGKEFVRKTEDHLRKVMRPLAKDIPIPAFMTYFSVLQQIIENAEEAENDVL